MRSSSLYHSLALDPAAPLRGRICDSRLPPALVLISRPGAGRLRSSPRKLAPSPQIKLCPESPRLTLNRKRKLEFVLAHHPLCLSQLFPKQTSSNRFPECSTFGMTVYYRPFRCPRRSALPSFPVSWRLPSSSCSRLFPWFSFPFFLFNFTECSFFSFLTYEMRVREEREREERERLRKRESEML